MTNTLQSLDSISDPTHPFGVTSTLSSLTAKTVYGLQRGHFSTKRHCNDSRII